MPGSGSPDGLQPNSMAEKLRSVSNGVPAVNTRERIIAALDAINEGYRTGDIEGRVVLFAPAMQFEDPAGRPRARNHAELREFYRNATGGGISLERRVEERIIVHDEAIERAIVTVHAPDQSPVYIRIETHFIFDPAGLIASYRAFFDRESITT